MKKIFISLICIFSSIVFASNTIKLTGEYSQELGNPFRALLEKKSESISIYSEDKEIELKVESNLDNNSIYNMHLQHPKKYILKNKTVENIMRSYYAEEYNVIHKRGNIEVNILSGKIIIDYFDEEQNQQMHHIRNVQVDLTIEVLNNNNKKIKNISMDNTLDKTGKNYSLSITSDDIKDINSITLLSNITNIIEFEVYKTLKDTK